MALMDENEGLNYKTCDIGEAKRSIPTTITEIEEKMEELHNLTFEFGEVIKPIRVEFPKPKIERKPLENMSEINERLYIHLNKLDNLYEYISTLKDEIDI